MHNPPTPDVAAILTAVQFQVKQVAISRDQLQSSVEALETVRREAVQAITYTRQSVESYQDGLKSLTANHRKEVALLQKDMEAESRKSLTTLQKETRQQVDQDHAAHQVTLAQTAQLLTALEQWEPQVQAAMKRQQEEWNHYLTTCEAQFSRSIEALPETVRGALQDAVSQLMDMVKTVETQQQADTNTLLDLKKAIEKQNSAVLQSLNILYSGQQHHEQQIQQIQQQVQEVQGTEEASHRAIVNHLQQVQASLQKLENDMAEARRPWWKRQRQVQPELPA